MTRDISQATLNTYFDYTDSSGAFRVPGDASFVPAKYMRRSDLHFITGKNLLAGAAPGVTGTITHSLFFQAPLGYANNASYNNLESLLNACGFYVFYGPDVSKPGFLGGVPDRHRFRLMQFAQPSEGLMIYDSSVAGVPASPNWDNRNWFVDPLKSSPGSALISQLAENVVALVILPNYAKKDKADSDAPLSADYEYNSRNRSNTKTLHQLPPVIQIVMVIIDEASAVRLGNTATPPNLGLAPLFKESAKLNDDLAELEKNLGALPGNAAGNTIPLRYEVFQTEVAIRGAKWSETP
jgi:uncharacterized protein (TIGR02599 family)